MTASAIYQGTIRHRRFAVVEHEFRHPIALAYIDLDELDQLLDGRLVAGRPGLVRFRRGDYLGDPAIGLADCVRALVTERIGTAPAGPIRVLAQLRTLGHCFNPVSFYYCFDEQESLQALVAEVTSTPWGERHCYVLGRTGDGPVLTGGFAKQLHVSPFMGMDQKYWWRASPPGPTLSVQIATDERGERAFEATLSLKRLPLTKPVVRRITARYPAASIRVLTLIYSHALMLGLKGVPVHPRPQVQP